MLLGERVSRATLFGEHDGHSGRGLSLVSKAFSHRDIFFRPEKSRFPHSKSHISDVQRLSRLFIAACLAYIWIVYLGSVGKRDRWRSIIHRHKRCDLSLFQLGLRLLEYFLNEESPIPVQFYVTI